MIGAASHLLYVCIWKHDVADRVHWKVVDCQHNSPLPRWGHTMVAWGHQLWVLGGENSSVDCLEDMHRFDIVTRWGIRTYVLLYQGTIFAARSEFVNDVLMRAAVDLCCSKDVEVGASVWGYTKPQLQRYRLQVVSSHSGICIKASGFWNCALFQEKFLIQTCSVSV